MSKKAELTPKPSISRVIAIMLKILRLFSSFLRKPRLIRFTTCLRLLSSASDEKSNTKPCAVGCIVLDLRIKKSLTYTEGDKKAQERFTRQMKRLVKFLSKERVLYMDEAGMLASDVYRWGWSEKGKRKYGQRAGIRQRRVNFIAATGGGEGGFIEPLVFEGACTREIVESWLEALVEQLPRDEYGQR